ncbi:MAG: prolyl oligopeptidase family serine peptidase [Traorella sp.]
MNYPKANEDQKPFIFDNKKIHDPYQWMKDGKNPTLKKWVAEENSYTDHFFSNYQETYQKYYQRNKAKTPFPSYSNITPCPQGYVMTKRVGDVYSIIETDHMMNETRDFSDLLSSIKNTTFFSGSICPNDQRLAVFHGLIDGYDRPSLFLFDLDKSKLLYQADGVFSYTFEKEGKALLYGDAKADVANKITYTFLKRFDFEKLDEECLLAYPDNAIMIDGYSNQDHEVVAQVMHDYSLNMIYFEKQGKMVAYQNKPSLVHYAGKMNHDHILWDYSQNEKGQVLLVNLENGQKRVIFESQTDFIKEVIVTKTKIYVLASHDVSSVCYVIDKNMTTISLPNECDASFVGQDDEKVFLMIESFNLPPQLYYLENNQCKPVFQNTYEADPMIQIDKVFYPSIEDKTMIPAYLIYRKDTLKNGQLPTLMYGYGGYNNAMPPTYHNPFCGLDIVDWVNDGGLYVHCCLRGGDEYGEKWHTDGYRLKKKNCFYDFIGIAEGIIQDGWTSPKHIAINGGSNGGLLMCALLTMRPDEWGCVVASVPHTDMISFVNDDRGPMYITEYGDPHDEEQFNYFMSYSPYHNIKKIAYPPTYIQTGECDNNVPPYHGKKMAAALQQATTSDNPILLRVLAKGSHDRGKGEVYLQTISEMQTFIDICVK